MIQHIIIICTSVCIILSTITSVTGVIYYINNKRRWEQEELDRLIRSSNIDNDLLI
jgi:hypothetical protein